jgi:polysaccharide pyruvyl transferase CsaB
VLSAHPAATEAEHGVRAVPRGTRAAGAAMRDTDLFISGGGGLLQDATSWRSPLYYLWLLRLARRRGLPVACLGHGVGPLRRRWVRGLTRRFLENVDVMAVRDHRSLEILRGLGLRRAVEVTADLAFLLPPPSAEEATAAWQKAGLAEKTGPAVAIAVRRLPNEDKGKGREIAVAALAACRAAHLRPVLIPMQRPGDLALAEEAVHAARAGEVVRVGLSARETLALLSAFDLVLAMRLHALIFAAISGSPLVAISYDPKVDGLMGELHLLPATSSAAFDAAALTQAVRTAWEGREELARRMRTHVARLRTEAQRNITLALQLVSR